MNTCACGREFVHVGALGSHARACDPERDERFVREFVDGHESVPALAARLGVTATTIRRALADAGVQVARRPSRRASSSVEPGWSEPPMPGWKLTGIDPPPRMASGVCLLCSRRFGSVDDLLDHYADAHLVGRVQPAQKCRKCFAVLEEPRSPHVCEPDAVPGVVSGSPDREPGDGRTALLATG
jgi:hypothetical protein